MADVHLPDGSQDRIGDRVHQGIGVRMPFQAAGMGDVHSAEDESPPLDQRMNVVAYAHMHHAVRLVEIVAQGTGNLHRGFAGLREAGRCREIPGRGEMRIADADAASILTEPESRGATLLT